jgi:hypothetical protein
VDAGNEQLRGRAAPPGGLRGGVASVSAMRVRSPFGEHRRTVDVYESDPAAPAPPQQAYAEPALPPLPAAAPVQSVDMSDRLAQRHQLGELLSAGV